MNGLEPLYGCCGLGLVLAAVALIWNARPAKPRKLPLPRQIGQRNQRTGRTN